MASLWFIVPAHGRLDLARICLRVLRWTCDNLEADGVRASAVVIADDENLDTARELGFATVERDNQFTSRNLAFTGFIISIPNCTFENIKWWFVAQLLRY